MLYFRVSFDFIFLQVVRWLWFVIVSYASLLNWKLKLGTSLGADLNPFNTALALPLSEGRKDIK